MSTIKKADLSTRELLAKSWKNTEEQANREGIARTNPAAMAGFLLKTEDGDVWRALAKAVGDGTFWIAVRNRLEGVRDEELGLKTGT